MNEEHQPARPGLTLIPLDDRAALLALKDFKRETAHPKRGSDDPAGGAPAGRQAA
jgi:hypothetical protein